MAASPSTPAPYDVVASWKASTGDTVYLREATWNGMLGWGYRKVVEYHNLTTAAVKAATMYPKDVRTLGPTTRRFETPVQDLPKRQRLPPPASPPLGEFGDACQVLYASWVRADSASRRSV